MSEMEIMQGTLDILVLRALTFKPMHGYAIVRFIKSGSAGTFDVKDGALYTALHRLEEREFVISEWGRSDKGKRARFYSITTAGRRELKAEAAAFEKYIAAVRGVMTAEVSALSV
jgi:PadR family transcriptional regulator PadR